VVAAMDGKQLTCSQVASVFQPFFYNKINVNIPRATHTIAGAFEVI
jgi:hypothetical protein